MKALWDAGTKVHTSSGAAYPYKGVDLRGEKHGEAG